MPTKLIVYPADRIVEIRESKKFGIAAEIKSIDFTGIMERMRKSVKKSHERMKKSMEKAEEFDYYDGEANFIGDYTLEVKGQTIKGKAIFIVSGARPLIPPIKGVESIEYLTNESALQLTERPESMIIVGGGYIAAEFAHFFEAMGTQVTIVQRNKRLVPEEEPEISELLRTALSRRMKVLTGTEAVEVRQTGKVVTVTAKERDSGKQIELTAHSLLIAAGRKSNADVLMVQSTGVKTDERGYIIVDDFLETTKKDIWAFGDAIGKKMFRHSANHEAELVWHNAIHGKKSRMNYLTVPHAVFSYPEIASVGLTDEQAIKLMGKHEVLVGRAMYADVARGEAMMETEGFTKAVVHRKSGKILGYHIIGPQASVLIQEVVNAMAADGNLWSVAKGMHIHPALSEVVLKAFARLEETD
ncbi:MAG TPA: dihydrolipoyl dehydrogenase [Nitrospirota bacterium]|nr:dihydrolipoyl dehydrogenase [Nitrospirota bacterium]